LAFTGRVGPGFKGRLVWTLAEAAGGRVLPGGRGEAAVADAQGMVTAKIKLDFPALKPGIVLKARLTVSLVDDAGGAAATHEKTIWIFHPNPFAGRTRVLRDLKITLYDPDPAGKTAAALKRLDVPFEEEKHLVEAVTGRKLSVVVVGEGVSFRDEPGLAEALVRLARGGATVICLAPSAGAVPIPGAEQDHGEEVSFFRRDVIRRLDKRLDVASWGGGKITASTLALKAVEGSVVGEVTAGSGGWPWLQVDYPRTKGRLIVCGFAVVARWQASPTPRYLFARMIEPAVPPE
jgi:hypothetical protein